MADIELRRERRRWHVVHRAGAQEAALGGRYRTKRSAQGWAEAYDELLPTGEWNPDKWVTDTDRVRSRTSLDLEGLRGAAEQMRASAGPITRFLDIGCGFGGLASLVGDYVRASEVHGLDIDPRVIEECRRKGVEVVLRDVAEGLPYPDDHFDAVMTLGMMDYLPAYDGMLREVNRILVPGGVVVVALPNLGSWTNRLSLLAGRQPRDVEISNEIMPGVSSIYTRGNQAKPSGHIHTATARAMRQLMTHHGFEEIALIPGQPQVRSSSNKALITVDRLMTRFPTLARRFFYVGRQVRTADLPERSNALPYQLLD